MREVHDGAARQMKMWRDLAKLMEVRLSVLVIAIVITQRAGQAKSCSA